MEPPISRIREAEDPWTRGLGPIRSSEFGVRNSEFGIDSSTAPERAPHARRSEPVILVHDFHKAYRETVAVDGLSFEVPGGAILALLGPNGAGKTTTLRALSGIIRPTRGRLFVAGHDVVHDPVAAKRELAYIPDDPKLFDALTVWEHLQFVGSAYRVADVAAKGDALLRQFELEAKRDTMAQELSRGMRQKVAICCAYLHEPRAILFDEPMTGLDPYAIRTLKASIVERAAAGAAIIV